jgi:hypothetical protein
MFQIEDVENGQVRLSLQDGVAVAAVATRQGRSRHAMAVQFVLEIKVFLEMASSPTNDMLLDIFRRVRGAQMHMYNLKGVSCAVQGRVVRL